MSETTTTVHHMTVAKASEKDIRGLNDFMNACEAFFDNRPFRANGIDIYEEDEEEYKVYTDFEQSLKKELGGDFDDRLIAFEFLRWYFNYKCNGSGSVIMGYRVMLDNACDETVDHLAFHPGFQFNHVKNEQ